MTTTKSYDFLNRLTQISSAPFAASVLSFGYSYNSANQRTRRRLADGSLWIHNYDTLGQLTSGKKFWYDWMPVAGQQFEYAFDQIGNRIGIRAGGDENGWNLRSAAYGANSLNQYTNRDVPGAFDVIGLELATNTVTVNGQTPYRRGEYFRKEVSVNNNSAPVWTNITVAAPNETTVNGNVFVARNPEIFGYDLDGNMTNDGRWSFAWDAENRLTSMASLSSVPDAAKLKLDFTYDYRSRRTRKIISTWNGSTYVPQSTNRFVYDGWNLIAFLNETNGLLYSFAWGTDLSGSLQGAGGVGGLLFITVYSGPSAGTYFYAYDGNGNVVALVNATDGTFAAQYEYGPFGELIRATGPLVKVNPFLFSTKFCDWESGFYYYGYRYYDPNTGRWLSRDPIGEGGGPILYGFVNNEPTGRCDPRGLADYQISFLAPTGFWIVSRKEVDHPKYGSLHGFRSAYQPAPQETCPCKKENILLVQAVFKRQNKRYFTFFDSGDDALDQAHHKKKTPIPDYWLDAPPWLVRQRRTPLEIVDAPIWAQTEYENETWEFEDCAVCRTVLKNGTVSDQVLGCVKFDFVRHGDGTANLEPGPVAGGPATAPTKGLWQKALKNWRDWTDH